MSEYEKYIRLKIQEYTNIIMRSIKVYEFINGLEKEFDLSGKAFITSQKCQTNIKFIITPFKNNSNIQSFEDFIVNNFRKTGINKIEKVLFRLL